MRNPRPHISIGHRTVLAVTCLVCGTLVSFPERQRSGRGVIKYVVRRCGLCRWTHLKMSKRSVAHW